MTIVNPALDMEAAIVSRSSSDRQALIRRVFRETGDALYRYILIRVHGDRNVADDLVQQTCHEAARSRRLPKDEAQCEAWFRGIARNLVRRHWRQSKRNRKQLSLNDPRTARQLAEALESGPLPPDALAQEEQVRLLMLAVTALPAADQQLVFAFYFSGRAQFDIAAEFGISIKSVESRLYRIRNRLRAHLCRIERT